MFKIREIKKGYIEKPTDKSSDNEKMEYAIKNYPVGTKHYPLDPDGTTISGYCFKETIVNNSVFKKGRTNDGTGITHIYDGPGHIYALGNWAEIIK